MSQDTQLKNRDKFVEATKYVKKGIMIVLRDGLSVNDPDSWPSLWYKKYGSLHGYPTKHRKELNGFRLSSGDLYFVCEHCDCINVIGNEEIGIW
jgi:hypothetical protein